MDYARMSWDDLIRLRAESGPEKQSLLAPYEHRAYAREYVAEKPWAAPAFLLMTPAYQVWKAMRGGARTKPSMEQLGQGLLGTFEGLREGLL